MPFRLDGLISRADIIEIANLENLILDDQERASILESMRTIDIQACPGSGKTTLIATKLILLARRWPLQHQGICVLSHTNVAKEEIIARIKKSKVAEAQCLLSFPHFIGTIQELVNRFLAIPYLRSKGNGHITVDNSEYVKTAMKVLRQQRFLWLSQMLRGLGDYQEDFLRGTFRDTEGNITMNRTARNWNGRSLDRVKTDLGTLKNCLDQRGFFLFRDMYTHAQFALNQNESLRNSIANRFPFVLIDEMQDTQKFQDTLLRDVFPLDEHAVVVQRFGDPDQAIFSGIGNEDPNESYNGKTAEEMSTVINKSHRFGNDIASKIKHLSFNCVNVESDVPEDAIANRITDACSGACFNHTVILFDDDNVDEVVPAFADLIAGQFSPAYKALDSFTAKIVGAVGNQLDQDQNKLKIGHYWQDFDKSRTRRNFKESSLIDAVRFCRQASSPDWAENYAFLKSCLIKALRAAEITDADGICFSPTTLKTFLKENGRWERYRKLMHTLLCDVRIDEGRWRQVEDEIFAIFGINPIPPEAAAYLAFVAEEAGDEPVTIGAGDDLPPAQQNTILHPDGFKIELSTIHGVKGETHDATLILETKNHCFDLGTMVPYLTQELPTAEAPNTLLRESPSATARIKPNRKFMRQLYVAVSRPKHLLCLAIHADRISVDQRATLQSLGWNLLQLPPQRVAE